MAASLTLISLGFTLWTLNIGYFTVSATADKDFDYDALPGTQHEFKVQVNAGKEECFAQKVALGAVFHVQYEVCIRNNHFAVVSFVDLIGCDKMWKKMSRKLFYFCRCCVVGIAL